jgi:fucokinase
VNVAILVNGVKPIGAKARIIKQSNQDDEFFLKVIMQDSVDDKEQSNQATFEFHNLDDFKDYNQPKAACCLVKAVCIHTQLLDLDKAESLSDQLRGKLKGSLEIRTWTGLPQGSGLGTSSILIACVLKVVWYKGGIFKHVLIRLNKFQVFTQ